MVADTIPLFAWSGPLRVPTVRPFVPDTVRAVVDAYGRVDAVVEVAVKNPAVNRGVPVATRFDPSQVRSALAENPAVLSPMVPEVVMVPPVNPLFVAI